VHLGLVPAVRQGLPWLRVAIVDHGPGIPEDELESIFDEFVQSSQTRTGAGGTGLGLAICRHIVAAHGGRIQARNAALGGAELIVEALEALPAGTLVATPQPAEGVTYAAKIGKAEAAVDWTRPAIEIERAVRAFNPFPGALASFDGTPVKLWRARAIDATGTPGEVLLAEGAGVIVACGKGALCITELQKPGGKRLPAADFLRGMPIAAGSRFD
jgi:hypothetical protein